MTLWLLPLLFLQISAAAASGETGPCPLLFRQLQNSHILPVLPFPGESELQEIPLAELGPLRPPAEPVFGHNHLRLYRSTLGPEDVFLKVSFARERGTGGYKLFEKEALWAKYLSDLGLGPKFHGITKTDEGYAIVTSHFPGAHVAELEDLSSAAPLLSSASLNDLDRIQSVFAANGIVPMDFHFRVGEGGRVMVIDPAFYLQKGRDLPSNFSQDGLGAVERFRDGIDRWLREHNN